MNCCRSAIWFMRVPAAKSSGHCVQPCSIITSGIGCATTILGTYTLYFRLPAALANLCSANSPLPSSRDCCRCETSDDPLNGDEGLVAGSAALCRDAERAINGDKIRNIANASGKRPARVKRTTSFMSAFIGLLTALTFVLIQFSIGPLRRMGLWLSFHVEDQRMRSRNARLTSLLACKAPSTSIEAIVASANSVETSTSIIARPSTLMLKASLAARASSNSPRE